MVRQCRDDAMKIVQKDLPSVADRLAHALKLLCDKEIQDQKPQRPTVTALCEIAGVSRNSLYQDHRDILEALRQRQQSGHNPEIASLRVANDRLRSENKTLREQRGKLASLVDHYYTAHREIQRTLQKREKELADLRRQLKTKPVIIR